MIFQFYLFKLTYMTKCSSKLKSYFKNYTKVPLKREMLPEKKLFFSSTACDASDASEKYQVCFGGASIRVYIEEVKAVV